MGRRRSGRRITVRSRHRFAAGVVALFVGMSSSIASSQTSATRRDQQPAIDNRSRDEQAAGRSRKGQAGQDEKSAARANKAQAEQKARSEAPVPLDVTVVISRYEGDKKVSS